MWLAFCVDKELIYYQLTRQTLLYHKNKKKNRVGHPYNLGVRKKTFADPQIHRYARKIL